jgi:hypothetical protein
MLVLSATGIRHAIAHGVGNSLQSKHPGLQLAHVHFSARQSPDIGERIKSHFFGLGYQLVQENAKQWVFHRERKPAGLPSTNVQAFDTTVTIRANAGAMGVVWVNCRWNVHTMEAMEFRGSVAQLEAEGHSLESLLNADARDIPVATGNERRLSTHSVDSGIRHADFQAVQRAGMRTDDESGTSLKELHELDEVQAIVDGPSTALIVVGVLTTIGSLICILMWLSSTRFSDQEKTWFFVPGLIAGAIVAFGAWNMRRLRSPGLSLVGAVFGLLPVTPGAVLSIPLSVWAIRILNTRDVRNAFIVRQRQRTREGDSSARPRFSRKAIFAACLCPVFFFFLAINLATFWTQRPGTGEDSPPLFAILLIGMPALLAPFLTTILGFMAVSDIRRSNGQLTGLGLALLDAALFPFLMLNVLICGACWFGLRSAGAPDATREMLVLVVAIMLALWNALAGWWLWKKVQIQ